MAWPPLISLSKRYIIAFLLDKERLLPDFTEEWQGYDFKERFEKLISLQVFDGAIIILSLAPMVASTVANGPSSPWDAISLIITLRIWRVKRIIDGEWRLTCDCNITCQAGEKRF